MEGLRIAAVPPPPSLLLLLLLLAGGGPPPARCAGLAIRCYQCNSAYDPRCGDPFDDYSLGSVNCSMKQMPEHLRPLNVSAVICRKNLQKVYGKLRVVRGCGYVYDTSLKEGRSCVQRSGTHDVQVHYCACEGDLCNGAPGAGLRPALPALLLLPLLLLLLLPQPLPRATPAAGL